MNRSEVDIWLRRAESNLAIARLGLQQGILLEDLCFEAQQAAEKALKALLIYLGGEYPRVHAFTVLLDKLNGYIAIPKEIAQVIELSDYAVQARYPGDYAPVDEQEYQQAVEIAQRVVRWVREQTRQHDDSDHTDETPEKGDAQ